MPTRLILIRTFSLTVLVMTALTLAGCGAVARVFSPHPPEEPVPPFSMPVFADFDRREYLPDRLIIPAIELDTPVVELGWSASESPGGRVFSQWDVAEYAAGWHLNSARLGEGGNVVMSGHNNSLGSVFRELDQLKQGDIATIWSDVFSFSPDFLKTYFLPMCSSLAATSRASAICVPGL